MLMAKVEYTPGRVAHLTILGQRLRIYAKPSLGITVIRKSGVARRSDKVRAINQKVAEAKPALACKGKPIQEFRKCLREQMKAALGKLSKAV